MLPPLLISGRAIRLAFAALHYAAMILRFRLLISLMAAARVPGLPLKIIATAISFISQRRRRRRASADLIIQRHVDAYAASPNRHDYV